jgi:hypothetical protein
MIAVKFERCRLVIAPLLPQGINVFVEKRVDSLMHLPRIQTVGESAIDFGITFEKDFG